MGIHITFIVQKLSTRCFNIESYIKYRVLIQDFLGASLSLSLCLYMFRDISTYPHLLPLLQHVESLFWSRDYF